MDDIVIIDDGITPSFFNIGCIRYDLKADDMFGVRPRNGQGTLTLTHGTYCAGIIRKYAPHALLSSVTVLDEKGQGRMDQLMGAIRWCIDHQMRVVNISLGSVEPGDIPELKKICREASEKGVALVAAISNDDVLTYPASFPFVIGVQCQSVLIENSGIPELAGSDILGHNSDEKGIDFTACGEQQLFLPENIPLVTPNSNSMATAVIAARVHHLMLRFRHITVAGVKKVLISEQRLLKKKIIFPLSFHR